MAAAANQVPTAAQLEQVKAAVRALLKQPEYDDGSAGPVLVRLAWHAAGTYDKETNTGGSNGAGMRYEQEGVRISFPNIYLAHHPPLPPLGARA